MNRCYRFGSISLGLCLALSLAACSAPAAGAAPASAPPAAAQSTPAAALPTAALAYTDDYVLLQDGVDEQGEPIYGLQDKDGKVLLPATYHEISIAENGLFFTSSIEAGDIVYRILRPDGTQIGEDYDYIECVSPDEDGVGVYRQASFITMRPVAPYAAYIEAADDTRRYWQLDENGVRKEAEPYTDMSVYDDGTVAACRDGMIYSTAPDGTLTQVGNDVESFFGGKYQVLHRYTSTHSEAYELLNQAGKEIAPPKYCQVQVPFENRYILSEGHTMTLDGAQAFLYDDSGALLAQDSNGYSFLTAADGSYVGVSWVGNQFDNGTFSPESKVIYDDAGNPAQHGYWFVDRDGKRLGERYLAVDFFQNEAAQQEGVHYTTHNKDNASESTLYDRRSYEQTRDFLHGINPAEAFFLALTPGNELVKLPFAALAMN